MEWAKEPGNADEAELAGFRFGPRGTHTSRTIMLAELADTLEALPGEADAAEYSQAIVRDNILGKRTSATREHSRQRLRELYGLDPRLPIFRVLRRLWAFDEAGRPLLALLSALARDPVLRATAPAVLPLPVGAELVRHSFLEVIRATTKDRLNEAVLDKVARNAGSSWSQSGHLEGRVRKHRRHVEPTPGSAAFAVWLGQAEGLGGRLLLRSRWTSVLDQVSDGLLDMVSEASRLRLLYFRRGGGFLELNARGLDPWESAR